MDVGSENLHFPPEFEKRPQTEEATPFADAKKPHCPSCKERWLVDESAQTGVSIAMHCEQPWVVIVCPKCQDVFMITACGKNATPEEGALVMHVDQYWIARVKK